MRMDRKKLALLFLILALVVAFFGFGLGDYFSLAYFKSQQALFRALLTRHPLLTGGGYCLVYVIITALSLPGATLMTLAGGALFGLGWGTLLVSFSSSIGATLAFAAARFVLRDSVQRRFSRRLEAVNRGVARDGAFYLLSLRLVPVVPFFVINLVMGLTPLPLATFYWVSQLGMLPGTLLYVNAGTRIGEIRSLSGIASPAVIGSLVALALFPLAARSLRNAIHKRRRLRGYRRPRRFDTNLLVIGAGSAGLVAAYIAAALRARVTLVEREAMGGDCLNSGCVPSKALIRSARVAHLATRAEDLGFSAIRAEFDFATVMERVQRVVRTIAPHDSEARYRELGVDVVRGDARIVSPWSVRVADREITARAIVVATGASPMIPPLPGLDAVDYLTSDSVWALREAPQRLLVLGGGAIGCELGQALARLGCGVTLVEQGERLLPREDTQAGERLAEQFRHEGIDVRLGHSAVSVRAEGSGGVLVCEHAGIRSELRFDRLLLALGRQARLQGFGLEALGAVAPGDKTLAVDEFMQTRVPGIYACGDVAGPYQFTHAAAHQAWYAAVNGLFSGVKRFKADYSVIPWAIFTDPEIARVGLNENEAQARGIPHEVTTYSLDELDRAVTDECATGLVKVLTCPGRDRILGATIVGEHAGELIAEFVMAMRHGLGLNKLLSTIHVYPTMMEANRFAAGAWKRAHAPRRALTLLGRYHDWRRR